MATDKSEPRVALIAKIGIASIVTLLVLHEVLIAYFDHVAQAEEYRKIGSLRPEALMSVRADEKQRLTNGAMPIEKAMQSLTTRGRTGASPDVMPSASPDIAPLQGWVKLPEEVPSPMLAIGDGGAEAGAATGVPAGTRPTTPGNVGDAGAGGAPRDAGLRKPPHKP
jgi:hypothetical protein